MRFFVSRFSTIIMFLLSLIKVSQQFSSSRLILSASPLSFTIRRPSANHHSAGFYSSEAYALAESAFSNLARKSRSWKRLNHMVELALTNANSSRTSGLGCCRTAVDIGTDHGLLALGLATSGSFDAVTGVDVSWSALKSGGLRLERELNRHLERLDSSPSHKFVQQQTRQNFVEFRCGDGLSMMRPGEANVACIAGMGVSTMIEILGTKSNVTGDHAATGYLIDDLGCQCLVLQPTNSRPRNLSLLYKSLHDMNWIPSDEKINFLSGRWYLSISFHRRASSRDKQQQKEGSLESPIPCSILLGKCTTDEQSRNSVLGYIEHHKSWLQRDLTLSGGIDRSEERWLSLVESFANNSPED